MSIPSVDLNLLLVLHAVLDERSVARAAARLHVTPSAISNALARLRVALGDPLVTRKGRGIVPTPRAMELAPAIARALHDLEVAVQSGPFDARTCARTFTLAIADAGQVAWLPRIAASFASEMPRARLRVVGIDSLVSLGDLASTEVDLHVGIRGRGAGLHVEPLFDEHMTLVARKGHPAANEKRLSLRALGLLHHVAVELAPGRGFRDPVALAYARAGVERTTAMTVPSFTTAAVVVAVTDLVATVPASFLAARGKALGVRALRATAPRQAVKMALCWHDRTHDDPAMIAFRQLVRGALLAGDGWQRARS